MATNHIPIDVTKRHGARLNNVIANLRAGLSGLQELTPIITAMVDGSSYTEVESKFGLESGDGEALYNLVSGAKAELEADSNFGNLINWVG